MTAGRSEKISDIAATRSQEQQLQELLCTTLKETQELKAEMQQQAAAAKAEAALMADLQAKLFSTEELKSATIKALWNNCPGFLYMALQTRAEAQHKVQQDELNQVREEVRRAEGIIAEERVATEEYRKKEQAHKDELANMRQAHKDELANMQVELQNCRATIAEERAYNEESLVKMQEMEGCLTAQKAKAAEAATKMQTSINLANGLQASLKEERRASKSVEECQAMQDQVEALQDKVDTLQKSLEAAQVGRRAAQAQLRSLQTPIQALAAAETTAALLAKEVDEVKKEAAKKLQDTTKPLIKRLARLETSIIVRAASNATLQQDLAEAQQALEVAKAAEQATMAALVKATKDAAAHVDDVQSRHNEEIAALTAASEKAVSITTPADDSTAADAKPCADEVPTVESDSPSQDQGGLLDTNEQPSLNTTQVAVGEQVSDESAVCEVCEGCHHSKEDCPVVKAAQQEEEEEAKEAGWQVVATKVKPSKAKGNKSKKGKKGKKKGDATAVVSVRKDGTIIRN